MILSVDSFIKNNGRGKFYTEEDLDDVVNGLEEGEDLEGSYNE